jgi:hypothetical protein
MAINESLPLKPFTASPAISVHGTFPRETSSPGSSFDDRMKKLLTDIP